MLVGRPVLPWIRSRIVKNCRNIMSEQASSNLNPNSRIDYTNWTKKDLLNRIYQLEGRNEENVSDTQQTAGQPSTITKKAKKEKQFDFSKYTTRKIALKFAYLGWNYQGLALQGEPTALPTIEEKIMEALFKVKLIGSLDQDGCGFSRCGRTDKGVSAMNQVISLNVRSKLTNDELNDSINDEKEIDYIKVLNGSLPEDIRVHSVCLRPPPDFDARFSCTFRHYKYIFAAEGLDIEAMNTAARLYLGENDFRNFCKVDGGKQITNFKRTILMSQIEPIDGEHDFYVFNLKGTAFLWHQVRCMIAVLLTVGQKLEDPSIVSDLLNVEKYASKPVYKMAHDVPLVLYDCGFDENLVHWTSGPKRTYRVNKVVDGVWNDYKIKSIVSGFMKNFTSENDFNENKIYVNLGDGIGQSMKSYLQYSKRERLETAEVINAKWKEKKKRSHSEVD